MTCQCQSGQLKKKIFNKKISKKKKIQLSKQDSFNNSSDKNSQHFKILTLGVLCLEIFLAKKMENKYRKKKSSQDFQWNISENRCFSLQMLCHWTESSDSKSLFNHKL